MKKLIIIIFVFLAVISCQEQKKSSQDIQNEIFEHKEKIAELEKILRNNNSESTKKYIIKVQVEKCKKENTIHTFNASGTAEAEESAFISPEMNGQISKVYVTEGQYVKKINY